MGGVRKNRLSDMKFDFISLVPRGDDPLAQVVISKAAPDEEELNMGDEITKDDLDEQVVAYIEGLETEVDTLNKSLEDAETARDEALEALAKAEDNGLIVKSEEEQRKALIEKADPAVRALLEKAEKDAEEAATIAKAERDKRLEREYLAKAEEMPHIGEERAAFGALLRRMADALSPEDVAEVEKVLKAADAQIEAGAMFSELGRGGGEVVISKSVEAAANVIRAADPSLTQEQAIAKAYETNPALLAEAMNEGR